MDNNIYGELLKKYVRDGKVDYAGFKTEEAKLNQYLKVLEKVDPDGLSRDDWKLNQTGLRLNIYSMTGR